MRYLLLFVLLLGLSSTPLLRASSIDDTLDAVPFFTRPSTPASHLPAREPGSPVANASPCAETAIEPNSAPPNWNVPASTTQCGTLETDNLAVAQSLAGGLSQRLLVTTAKYGLTPRVEVRWGVPARVLQTGAGTATLKGITDQWLGLLYRVHDQKGALPDIAIDYALKLPTANPAKGFGTGFADHQFTFIATRTRGLTRIDFNAVELLAGSPHGIDSAVQFGAALTRSIRPNFLLTLESFGGVQPGTPDRYGAALVGGAFGLRPWLSINGACARAFTEGVPRQQVFVGFIYTTRPAFRARFSFGRLFR